MYSLLTFDNTEFMVDLASSPPAPMYYFEVNPSHHVLSGYVSNRNS